MKSNNNKSHSSKLNIILVIAALLALIVSAITVSYSWIESANSLNINSNGGVAGNGISVNAPNPGVAAIDLSKTSVVDLSQYIDNSASLFLAPAKLNGTTLQIKRDGGAYSNATTNDIGNNYIEFDVPFTVAADYKFKFTDDSSITVDGSTSNPIKVSVQLGSGSPKVFNAALNNAALSDTDSEIKTAFSARASLGQQYIKVRIWLDGTDATATALKGKDVSINLNIVAEETQITDPRITIADSTYAIVTATYKDAEGKTQTISEGSSSPVPAGTVITVSAKTANGKLITSGSDMVLNGHQFSSYSVDNGSMSVTSSSTSGNTKITTATYTVGDSDAVISTNTSTDSFILGGINVSELAEWNGTKTLTYNEELNCVYATVKSTNSSIKFKIVSGTDFGKRDDSSYSASINMTSDNIISSGVTGAGISSETEDKDKCFVYTAPVNQDILVIYYLDSIEVEMTTDTVLKTHYIATANVSTANQHGTATVTYGDTTASTVSVPRRAANKQVTFTATPSDSNYRFVGWSTTNGGTSYVSTDAEYKRTLTGDLTLYANFKRVYTLTVTPANYITATGITFDVDATNKGTASIVEGTTVNLTATAPDTTNTYKVEWLDGGTPVKTDTIGAGQTSTTSSYSITNMSAAHDIRVLYTPLYKLTVQKTGDGASDSNATVSSVVKDSDGNSITLTNGVAYVPAGTTAVVTANAAAGGNPYRVSSNGTAGAINGKNDLIPTTSAASFTFNSETINANTTISINFERLYKVTYSITDSVATAAITANATESGSTSKPITSPAYLPKSTVVEFTVTPSGDGYIHAYSKNSGAYTFGSVPSQKVTADTDIKVKVVNSRTVTIDVPDPTVATLTATYTFPGVTGSKTLTIAATAGPQTFKLPEGATITVTANVIDSKDKFNNFTVTGSTSVTQDSDNKSVAVVVQDSDITITPNITIMSVAECAQDIVNENKVSFYAGTRFINNTGEVIVAQDGQDATVIPVRRAPDYTNVSIDGKVYQNVVNVTEVPSQVYYIKQHTEWGGVATEEAVQGGKFYGVYSASYGNDTPTSYGPTTATTALSASEVELNATGVTVTTGSFSSTTTAIGTQFYVQHFIKKSTDSEYTFLATSPKITATTDTFVTDISEYAQTAGTYEIKTVLTDGKVYYVVDTDTIKVVEKFDVTVNSATNAKLVVKNGATTLGTINAGATAQTFKVVKGDSISVTATPTDNTGVYDFQWSSTGKTISKKTNLATSTYTEIINNDTTIGVTVDNHSYKLTYSGVTATYSSGSYVPANTEVTLTFTDSTNHNKVVWSVNSTVVQTTDVVEKGSEDTYTVTMNADKTVSVTKTTLYKLTYSITGAATSTLKSDLSTASADTAAVGGSAITKYVTNNKVVTFTVTKPDADNYYTVSWKTTNSTGTGTVSGGHLKSATETKNYTITSDTTVEVTVTKSTTYAVKINKPTNASLTAEYTVNGVTGTISDINTSGATVNLPEGATVKVTATAHTGYQFDSYTVKNGTTTTTKTDNPYTITVGTNPIEITVKTSAAAERIIYLYDAAGTFSSSSKPKIWYWKADSNNENSTSLSSKHFEWGSRPEMTLVDGYSNIWSYTLTADAHDCSEANWFIFGDSGNIYCSDISLNMYNNKTKTWSTFPPSTTEYTVTVTSNPNANITVKRNDTNATVASGDKVPKDIEITVTVTPNTSYNVTSITIGSSTSPYTASGAQTKTAKVTENVTVSAEVELVTKRIYFDTSNAGWFNNASAFPAIKYSGHDTFIYLGNQTEKIGSKTYYYCDVPTNVSGITLRRQTAGGDEWNPATISDPTTSQNLFTIANGWTDKTPNGIWSVLDTSGGGEASTWYLIGNLNNNELSDKRDEFNFKTTSDPNVFTLTYTFTDDNSGKQYLQMLNDTVKYAPTGYELLSEDTDSTNDGKTNGGEKWGIAVSSGTTVTITWNASTNKIKWVRS